MTDSIVSKLYSNEEREPSDELGKQLLSFIEEHKNLIEEQAELEDQLKKNKERQRAVLIHEIPNLMGSMEEYKGNGYHIKVKESVFAGIRADKKEEAIEYLEKNGQTIIVTRKFDITFPKSLVSTEMLERLKPELEKLTTTFLNNELKKLDDERPLEIEPEINSSYDVNKATLKRVAKEFQDEGKYFPDNIFTVYEETKAEYKPLKK